MKIKEKLWGIGGAVTIAAKSSLLLSAGSRNIFVPMPFYLVIAAWMISFGFIIVLPLIYLIKFMLPGSKKYFGKITLITGLFLSVLNIFFCYPGVHFHIWENFLDEKD